MHSHLIDMKTVFPEVPERDEPVLLREQGVNGLADLSVTLDAEHRQITADLVVSLAVGKNSIAHTISGRLQPNADRPGSALPKSH